MSSVRADADTALRLVVARDEPTAQAIAASDEPTLREIVATLRENVVLVRAARALTELGGAREALDGAADAERERVERVLRAFGRIVEALDREGVEHVLPKAFQHAPDMGHDVDLFVRAGEAQVAGILARAVDARPVAGSVLSRFAGKRAYEIAGVGPVEVHHGRLGHLGEHAVLARAMFERRRRGRMGPLEAWIPAPEEHLLHQVIQRVHAHRRIRACDVVVTIGILGSPAFDRERVSAVARATGIAAALRWYLAAVDAIVRRIGGGAITAMRVDRATAPAAERSGYAVPLPTVARAYAAALAGAARAGELGSAARIAALPALAVATLIDRARPR